MNPQHTAIMEDLDTIDKGLDALIAEKRDLQAALHVALDELRQRTAERDALAARLRLSWKKRKQPTAT